MLKYTVKKYCSEGSKINQIFLAILIILPVFSYGTAVGWLSPMSYRLMSQESPASKPVHPDVISWMASVPYLVGIPMVFLFGYIVDNYGRKKALLLTSFSMAVAWSLKLLATEPWILITARAVMGLGVSGSYVVTPLYIKEISEDSIRGILGSLVILSQNMGNFLVYLVGEYLSYHLVLWLCLAVPLLHLLLFSTMSETPSYLLKIGKVEEARYTLAWLRCKEINEAAVDTELQVLLDELQNQKPHRLIDNIKSIVTDKPSFRAFRITFIITLARELCGCLAVLHFASTIFAKASGTFVLNANQQAMVLGAVQLLGSCTASSLVEKTGRKPLLTATCFLSGLCMMSLGVWMFVWSDDPNPQAEWLPIVALCLVIFCDAGGLQPVPFVIMTEMFSFQHRGTVTSLVIAFACALVSVELRLFHPLTEALGMHVIFWMFSSVCIISTVYIIICVPETKMRSLDEIYEQLSGKKKDCEANVTRL